MDIEICYAVPCTALTLQLLFWGVLQIIMLLKAKTLGQSTPSYATLDYLL